MDNETKKYRLTLEGCVIWGQPTDTVGEAVITVEKGGYVTIRGVGIVPASTWPVVVKPTLLNAIKTWWLNRKAFTVTLKKNPMILVK